MYRENEEKLTMERNMHSTYYYEKDTGYYIVRCYLNDYTHDMSVEYKVDMNTGLIVDASARTNCIPEAVCQVVPKLCKQLIGVDVRSQYMETVYKILKNPNGCENLLELFAFSGSALYFIWARHMCEIGQSPWQDIGKVLFEKKAYTCLGFNPEFDPSTLE